MDYDLVTTEQRMKGIFPKNLRIARAILFTGLGINLLMGIATFAEYQKVESIYHSPSFNFIPIH